MMNRDRNLKVQRVAVYVLFFASLSLLLALGTWQWRRGVEKAVIERVLESARDGDDSITLARAPRDWRELAHRRVRLDGEWLAPSFHLANRSHRGRIGHEVFTPFRLSGDGAVLLINRGWIAADARLAHADDDAESSNASGFLYLPQVGFTLGPAIAPSDAPPAWPREIQHLDLPALSREIGIELQPAALALDGDHPHALTPIYRANVIPSSRHYGYAVQWWGLGITLIVFGIIWRRRARGTNHR